MQQATHTDVPARYAPNVPGRKVSVVLDEDTLRRVREIAQYNGLSVSAWMARAARYHVQIDEGLRGVDEYEAEFGPIPAESLRWADDVLDKHGIPRLKR